MIIRNNYNKNNIDQITLENHLPRYLDYLNDAKEHFGIALCIRDTAGRFLPDGLMKKIQSLGFTNFTSKVWGLMFSGLSIYGKTFANDKGIAPEEPVHVVREVDNHQYELRSEAWRKGNKAQIIIDGVDYSTNMRGLNFVVFDPSDGRVIDSIGFDCQDIYKASAIYHRTALSGDGDYAKVKALMSFHQSQMEMLMNYRFDMLEEKLDRQNYIVNAGYWALLRREGESKEDAKKRFFMEMPPAEGVLGLAQKCESIILKMFHKIAVENDIKYWINFGTLIGAVRHGGFIPWDDDIDLCVTRDQLPKIIEVLKNDEYLDFEDLYAYAWDGLIHYMRIIFRKLDNCFVDIFVYDEIDDPSPENILEIYKVRDEFRKESLKNKSGYANKPENVALLEKYNDIIKTRFAKENKKKAVIWSIDNYTQGKAPFIFYDDIFPLKLMKFDGYDVYAPNNYDPILKDFYGDYYALPGDAGKPKHLHYTDAQVALMKKYAEEFK